MVTSKKPISERIVGRYARLALAMITGVAIGILISGWGRLEWKFDVNVVGALGLLLNLAVVVLAATILRARDSWAKHAGDHLSSEIRWLDEQVCKLHREIVASEHAPMSSDKCDMWLQNMDETMTRVGALSDDARGWKRADASETCNDLMVALKDLKKASTSGRFPAQGPSGQFSITVEERSCADEAMNRFRRQASAFRRRIVG